MEKTKTIAVFITALKITSEDEWLQRWVAKHGDGVRKSPHHLFLTGNPMAMVEWMTSRGLKVDYLTRPMMETLQSIIQVGQLEPIKVYKDMRINTGHKRAACMMFLGFKAINAIVVPDDYKL